MFFTDGYTFILHWWIFSLVYSWWILIDIYNTFKWTVPSLIYSYICVQDHHQSIFLLSISVKTASRQALMYIYVLMLLVMMARYIFVVVVDCCLETLRKIMRRCEFQLSNFAMHLSQTLKTPTDSRYIGFFYLLRV